MFVGNWTDALAFAPRIHFEIVCFLDCGDKASGLSKNTPEKLCSFRFFCVAER